MLIWRNRHGKMLLLGKVILTFFNRIPIKAVKLKDFHDETVLPNLFSKVLKESSQAFVLSILYHSL